MKKLAAGLAATMLTATGLAALSTESASADPYPGTVNTYCHAWKSGRAVKGGSVKVVYSVGTSGNGQPEGTVTIAIEKFNHRDSASATKHYSGGTNRLRLPVKKAGRYNGTMTFNAPNSSVFQDCSKSFTFRVKRR